MDKDEWWKNHVVRTWRTWSRHERGIRRFLMRWMFQGLAKTYVAAGRHTAVPDAGHGTIQCSVPTDRYPAPRVHAPQVCRMEAVHASDGR